MGVSVNLPIDYKDCQSFKSLNIEQKISFCAAMSGEDMLVTGGGGVGKSHFIKTLKKHKPDMVVSASTGVAAVNVDGVTVSSFFGFFRIEPVLFDLNQITRDSEDRIKETSCLLIDEFSMTRIDQFHLIDKVFKYVKKSNLPFGGVQIIIVADFCQLKPVMSMSFEARNKFNKLFGLKEYGFESSLFQEKNITPYLLSEYIRNEHPEQSHSLKCLRLGINIDKAVDYINSIVSKEIHKDAIHLCTTNKSADSINKEKYEAIQNPEKTFYAQIINDGIDDCPVARVIKMKVGTRVMFVANNSDEDYYNGDLGTITGFSVDGARVVLDRGPVKIVKQHEWNDKKHQYSKNYNGIKQIPLTLAFAITIHKSQGMTLPRATLDLRSGCFTEFQAYVGLSRVGDLRNITLLRPLLVSDITINKKAVDFTFFASKLALARRENDINKFGLKKFIEA